MKRVVRALVERWADAVRRKDLEGILADHSPDIVMFDVPPPLQSIGLDAYRKTWDVFFAWSQDSGVFDIDDMTVTAGSDVAFVVAVMHCAGNEPDGQRVELRFRLTVASGRSALDGPLSMSIIPFLRIERRCRC
jgi:ketosteroid isomerase-like protein